MQAGEDEEDNDDDDETVIYGGNDEDEGDGPLPPPSMGRASRSGENRTTRCARAYSSLKHTQQDASLSPIVNPGTRPLVSAWFARRQATHDAAS